MPITVNKLAIVEYSMFSCLQQTFLHKPILGLRALDCLVCRLYGDMRENGLKAFSESNWLVYFLLLPDSLIKYFVTKHAEIASHVLADSFIAWWMSTRKQRKQRKEGNANCSRHMAIFE